MEQNLQSYKGVRFTAEATISGINLFRDCYYISCHQCGIAVTAHGDSYTCLDHGPQSGPFFRYKFKGYITDTTATARITFFTPAADKVTDHPCAELVEKHKPIDPKKIRPEILAAQGKIGVFQFHLNTLGNLTDLTLDAVFDIKKQDQSTGSSAQEPSKGTPSSTSAATTQSMQKQQETQKEKETSTVEEGAVTPPPIDSTTTDTTRNKEEIDRAQGKSAKRAFFDQQSTEPKKHKGD